MKKTNLTGNIPFKNKAIQHDVSDSIAEGDSELRYYEEYNTTIQVVRVLSSEWLFSRNVINELKLPTHLDFTKKPSLGSDDSIA